MSDKLYNYFLLFLKESCNKLLIKSFVFKRSHQTKLFERKFSFSQTQVFLIYFWEMKCIFKTGLY